MSFTLTIDQEVYLFGASDVGVRQTSLRQTYVDELLLSKRDTMANSEACHTRRGTENRKKSSAGVTATKSFQERCCLGVPVADTSYQLPTAKAPGQPAATAYFSDKRRPYVSVESSCCNQVAFDDSSFMIQRNHIFDSRLDHECGQSVPRRIPHCHTIINSQTTAHLRRPYVSNYRNISDSQCEGDRKAVPAYHANIFVGYRQSGSPSRKPMIVCGTAVIPRRADERLVVLSRVIIVQVDLIANYCYNLYYRS
ncbi:hypothetical protein T12_4076 [Trichinella patagoniensis]|uniref:Uncharacterized protein n=1 Tax=Trichinella patagoniensis TaxID=990121 RepID=A0A0V0ZA87_9BILA|nr:hypothetical protein T12_4076 [Trichinella patagoniensis]